MYRILLVDDDEAIGFVIEHYQFWEKSDFKIEDKAKNGKEALIKLKKETFDLIITDIRMPIIDGLEFVRQLRAQKDMTPVLFASTYSDFKYAKEGIRLGVIDYIEKPFTEEKLKEALRIAQNYLEEKEEIAPPKQEHLKKLLYEGISIRTNMEAIYDEIAINNGRAKAKEVLQQFCTNLWQEICEKAKWVEIFESESQYLTYAEKTDYIQEIVKKYEIGVEYSIVFKTCSLLFDNIGKQNVITFVSEEIELSRDYLGRIFKNQIGYSLLEFITQIRIHLAKKQLEETDIKVYELAEQLGYQTTDYFTNLFRKYTNMTPIQYRKSKITEMYSEKSEI